MSLFCPLCNSNEHAPVYDKTDQLSGGSIVQCTNCRHYYTLLSAATAGENYGEGAYKLVENRNSIFDKIMNAEYRKVVKRIFRYKKTKGSLLDFGSGKGKFASLAKQEGWDVKCVETAVERAAYAAEIYDLEVNTSFYTTGSIFNRKFDVLTLFHVAEHLPEPKSLLRNLFESNLVENGLVIIEVPNFKSLQQRIARKRWMHLDPNHHVSHFTEKKLEQLCAGLGLKTKRTTYFSFHLGVLGMVDSLLKKIGYRKNIIIELKKGKNKGLRLAILALLLPGLLLEFFASLTGHGGVIRKYLVLSH